MNEIQIFNYQDKQVRTVEKDGEPWWVLKDVCEVLELSTPAKVAERLDSDEKGVRAVQKITLNELEKVLYDFVKRAASKEATPEEIAVLPKVARVLAKMLLSV